MGMSKQINVERECVTLDRCRALVGTGWMLEVLCVVTAVKRHANYFGEWSVTVVSPDCATQLDLVTARNAVETRSFRTINGLVSFLEGFGVFAPQIPLRAGMRQPQRADLRTEIGCAGNG